VSNVLKALTGFNKSLECAGNEGAHEESGRKPRHATRAQWGPTWFLETVYLLL